jgi:GNAT superfamily N-acetyltransferase
MSGRSSIELVESVAHPATHVILDGLRNFNETYLGRSARPVPLTVFVQDDEGTVQGGIVGQYLWEWLYVDKFWLSDAVRGTGLGSSVLARAEAWAVEQGARWSHLQTLDFQALPFYERHGYVVFAALEDYPPGGKRYYLRKTLTT